MSSWWTKEVTGRPRRVIWVIIFVVVAALFATCLGLGGGDAQAATTIEDPQAPATTYDFVAVPYGRSGQCWEFGPWPWQNTDAVGHLRFGWGHDLIACTNDAATKWVSLPTYDIWHWLGYWQFDKQSKSHSKVGYSWLDSTSYWRFKYDALGVPLATKERTLKCRYTASDHTANCTLYS